MYPHSYTDPQNHRMQFCAAAVGSEKQPHVLCTAENLAPGGETADVLLPTVAAHTLADRLDQQATCQFIAPTGDTLMVEPADAWTRFTFIREPDQEETQERFPPGPAKPPPWVTRWGLIATTRPVTGRTVLSV
ncbi:hypothetical protein AB0B04_32210 [Streptomyces xinghaiensis]|uniref:Uncharacterized protein n=2 Tax=Streptomyces TaxID=1883 RepID=A0A3R7LIU5_9ACTN|nr:MULTISPECIES: hypothetical protein [Streptomyces]KNE80142.1 hypothetical protein ADZ36_23670 [Streptomyces fradiae]OFA50976.1 hypothetical protein BEN35_15225 [Streptomyces fradiae]PQM19528.1 hypothetical protein Sfr7A_31650 [Streptomyces xinghaiensis]RKM90952.1 hypothetical protein SFRA_030445 [Streptomyces xinghaiensis]RNC68953.1 hypothetical protein DC095_030690 [Streptomyces xinghaiensis]